MIAIIRQLILMAALAHNTNVKLMDRIAYCESTWNQFARNGTAVGLYQLNTPGELDTFYAEGYSNPFDPSQQSNFVAEKLKQNHLSPWYASYNCWRNYQ